MAKPLEGHYAKKRFGQNFLVSDFHIEQIIRAINPRDNQKLIEIGPGLGAITKHLLPPNSQSLTIIEIDNDLAERLEREYGENACVSLINKDVLTVNFTDLNQDKNCSNFRIIGNLPYNISTPLLFHICDHLDVIKDLHIMLQKEVADRITADNNNKKYGRLSVMMQYYFHAESCFDIPPSAFQPEPKVDSAFIRLIKKPKKERNCSDEKLLAQLCAVAFQQRRKVIRKTLHQFLSEYELEQLYISPMARPEQLSVEEFVIMADFVAQK